MNRRTLFVLLGLAPTVLAASALHAQQPATPPRLVLKGYDPVAYFTDGKPAQGKPEIETVFDGARYRFVSTANLERFKADPDKYAPQFAGNCTAGLTMGKTVEADPEAWRIVNGKLYVFSTGVPDSMKNDPAVLAKADEGWKARPR